MRNVAMVLLALACFTVGAEEVVIAYSDGVARGTITKETDTEVTLETRFGERVIQKDGILSRRVAPAIVAMPQLEVAAKSEVASDELSVFDWAVTNEAGERLYYGTNKATHLNECFSIALDILQQLAVDGKVKQNIPVTVWVLWKDNKSYNQVARTGSRSYGDGYSGVITLNNDRYPNSGSSTGGVYIENQVNSESNSNSESNANSNSVSNANATNNNSSVNNNVNRNSNRNSNVNNNTNNNTNNNHNTNNNVNTNNNSNKNNNTNQNSNNNTNNQNNTNNGGGTPTNPNCPPHQRRSCPPLPNCNPPRQHGNNGVGNGQDPQLPGNPPVNDGPGSGPGNPGNRGGRR